MLPTPSVETAVVLVPSSSVGAIIGSKGNHIRNIIRFSGASVKIEQPEEVAPETSISLPSVAAASDLPTEAEAGGDGQDALVQQAKAHQQLQQQLRRVVVVGSPESQWRAQYMIFEKLREEHLARSAYAGMSEDIRLAVEMNVPSGQVGRIIGKGGVTVRDLQRITGAAIRMPAAGTDLGEETPVHIVGSFYSVQVCSDKVLPLVSFSLKWCSISVCPAPPPCHDPAASPRRSAGPRTAAARFVVAVVRRPRDQGRTGGPGASQRHLREQLVHSQD
jgi:insulin-like growth factor 2 mRNA-binding protein 1